MRCMKRLVSLEIRTRQQWRQQLQSCAWPGAKAPATARFASTTGERCSLREYAVEICDLLPVRLGVAPCLHVQRGDRRLQLVGARARHPKGALQQANSFRDPSPDPISSDPVIERRVLSVAVDASRPPGVVEQHQREQPRHLRLVRHQVGESPAEPDRLTGAAPRTSDRLARRSPH